MNQTLMVAPRIARADWKAHPNYPHQVLLLGSHQSFRRVAETLQREVRRSGSMHGAQDLFERWMGAMSGHEGYEERKLYRYLECRWGVDLTELRQGHEELHACRDEVRGAFDSRLLEQAEVDGHGAARARLRRALDAYEAVLLTHLDLEEERVIPLLLELSPDEFAAYYALPIRFLLDMLDGKEVAIAQG